MSGTGRPAGRLRLVTLYLIICVIWGTTWYGMKLSVDSLPPMTAAGLRFATAFPFLLGAVAFSRDARLMPPPGRRWLVPFIAIFYIIVPYALINYGEQHISSGLAAVLFSSVVVFLVLFSVLVSRITVRPLQWVGIVVGLGSLVGIFAMSSRLQADGLLGPAAVLAAAIMHAFTYAVLARAAGSVHVLTQETLPIGLGAAALLVMGALVEHPDLRHVSRESLLGVLYLGVIASVLGFAIYFHLLKRLNAVTVSYVFLIFPIVAMLGSAVLEGAAFSPIVVGLTLLMLGGFALTKRTSTASQTSTPKTSRPRTTARETRVPDPTVPASPEPPASTQPASPAPPASAPPDIVVREVLGQATLDAIFAHARADFPAEACGFVHASGRVQRARNAVDELHRLNPERYPRTRLTGYALATVDIRYLEDQLDAADPVKVIYHSHPNGRAYFSDEDRRNAVVDGYAVYPSLSQLVVGIDGRGVQEARLFHFVDGDYVLIAELLANRPVEFVGGPAPVFLAD